MASTEKFIAIRNDGSEAITGSKSEWIYCEVKNPLADCCVDALLLKLIRPRWELNSD
jgi:hypothetical protein